MICVWPLWYFVHFNSYSQLREKTADQLYDSTTAEEDPQLKGLLSEVQAWKKEYQK